MVTEIITAEDRRKKIQAKAAAMGINEAFISELVDTFYTRVRAHPELGPLFENVLEGRWDFHLERMKNFWSSVTLNTGRYSGKPVPAHMKLTGISASNFQTWLALFRTTLEDTAATPEAIEYIMERADRIAESLQLAMFGLPEIGPERGQKK